MPLLQWTDEFTVNVPHLDEQHRKLVYVLNSLYDALQTGQQPETLQSLLAQLTQYTVTHFAAEEKHMEEQSLTDLAEHAAEHKRIAQQMQELKLRVDHGETERLTPDLLAYFCEWLRSHIQIVDRKYSPQTAAVR